MLIQPRTIAASVTKLVIFFKIAVGKLTFITLSNWEAANHGEPQETNSGDEDYTCISICKPRIEGIGLPVDEKTCLHPHCTGRWWNLRSGLLGPACLYSALLSVRSTQSEASES